MEIITLNIENNLMKLNSFIESHDHSNFFQSVKAYNFFIKIEFHSPIFIVAKENDEIVGSLLALIIQSGNGIKGFMSRRCIIWGGPLVKNDNDRIYFALIDRLNILCKNKVIYIEFRNFSNLLHKKTEFQKNGYKFNEHLNYIVSTYDKDNKAKLSNIRKRQINKSVKNGAKIVEPSDLDQIKNFYNILKNLYKEKVHKPLPSFQFFKLFFEQANLGKYFLVIYDNRIIGGIMCPIYKDIIYELYVCGLDKHFKNIYPSVLATWAPIEYATNNGLKYFDFMGAGQPDQNYGVREFKSKFGGELVNYGRFKKVNNRILYKIGKFGVKLLSKLSS